MTFVTRLVKSDEIELLVSILEKNPFSNGVELSKSEILEWCTTTCDKIAHDRRHVVLVMDKESNPLAFVSATPIPEIAGWIQGLSVMKNWGHAATTAETIAAGVDELLRYYEGLGYYKYWDTSTKRMQTTGRELGMRYSKLLKRYEPYDERIIPAGEKSGVLIWDKYRRICHDQPVITKLFVLKQKYRLELINK